MELDPREILWDEFRISSQYNDAATQGLRQSMADDGQQDPIVVYCVGETWRGAGGKHRCEAAIENGAPTITAVVRVGSEEDVLRANYATGLNQQKADPLSVAETLWNDYNTRKIDLGVLSKWSGRPAEYLLRIMHIAVADPGVKQALGDGLIVQGHAELLAQLEDHEEQRKLLNRLLLKKFTVKELADIIMGRENQGDGDAAPAPTRGQRRSTKPTVCNQCQKEFEAGAGQTLQVCDGCIELQDVDRALASAVRGCATQLAEAELALAESPQFVWLAEMIGQIRGILGEPATAVEVSNAPDL